VILQRIYKNTPSLTPPMILNPPWREARSLQQSRIFGNLDPVVSDKPVLRDTLGTAPMLFGFDPSKPVYGSIVRFQTNAVPYKNKVERKDG
jgi:hypothetical protein